jgi:hypothetical protein
MLVHFTAIWYIVKPFGILLCHLVYFVVIWCIISYFGMFNQEQSGNPKTAEPSSAKIMTQCNSNLSKQEELMSFLCWW